MDPDAAAYITAVETADGQALEEKVKIAIDNFVLGCKADGIWSAIKASCILAGARTLDGALVPLVGTAPTNYNFVSGDYNRETGLKGNGSNKYLDSNRNNNADPQDSQHLAAWMSVLPSDTVRRSLIGCGVGDAGSSQLNTSGGDIETRSRSSTNTSTSLAVSLGFAGLSRSNSSSYLIRHGGAEEAAAVSSQVPLNENINIFRRESGNLAVTNARLSFYSIGEALDLARLDARVTDLINAIGVAIP